MSEYEIQALRRELAETQRHLGNLEHAVEQLTQVLRDLVPVLVEAGERLSAIPPREGS